MSKTWKGIVCRVFGSHTWGGMRDCICDDAVGLYFVALGNVFVGVRAGDGTHIKGQSFLYQHVG